MNNRLPDTIEISWHIDDILELDKGLSKNEAREILQMAKKYHDATIGINWDVLRCHIDYYKRNYRGKENKHNGHNVFSCTLACLI